MSSKTLTLLTVAAIGVVVVVCALLFANRPQIIRVNADIPPGFPASGFSHDTFASLLRKYVDSAGNVEFDSLYEDAAGREQLESYLAAVSAFSPESTPDRFEKRADELAYWMYGYNGYVIKSVLDHWPISSVTDVKAPIEAVTGLGFFYRQRFHFGGVPLSLYKVENEKIRKSFRDPRIHFVLYCASNSCPVLRPELPTGDDLEKLLQDATLAFVSDPRNVQVIHERALVNLSAIFEMYRSDFTRDLTRRGLPSDRGVIDYVVSVAPDSLQAELQRAIEYEVRFNAYDWGIAGQE